MKGPAFALAVLAVTLVMFWATRAGASPGSDELGKESSAGPGEGESDVTTVDAYRNGQGPISIRVAPIRGGYVLREDAAAAFEVMADAAAADGVTLKVDSAYRSMTEQTHLAELHAAGTLTQAVAKPGYSNHQGGVAVDVDTESSTYGKFAGPVFEWLAEHAAEHGFSNDEGSAVGEPWHWVFVGNT